MHKLDKLQIVKNVSSSWLVLATNALVGIFIAPVVLHHLGDAAFGIWILILSITGYYGLFDFGIRSSVLRDVSRFVASKDREALAKVVNTSLFSYSCIAFFTLLLTLTLSFYVNRLFHLSSDLYPTAKWILLIVGSGVALGFPFGISGSLLEGLQRFDILNATGVVATLVRALLIVVAVQHQRGLVTVAVITVLTPLVISALRGLIALRICPLPFSWRYVNRATFRGMVGYSGLTFMTIVAGRLKFKTDEIVIGSLMSAAAITYFNIGARIVDYTGEFVLGLAQIFLPMSSQSDATGDMTGLRRIFIVGNRLCALVMFPVSATLIILGKSIIEVWVGKKYVAFSYPVLVIMILAATLMWAQGASPRILFGMGRHGTFAVVTLIEGIANVILSIVLVRSYGIIGDSLGTAIPLLCTMVLFLPWHLCRRLDVRLSAYVKEAYAVPALLCLPPILTLILLKKWFVPHTYTQLAFQLAVAGSAYGIGLAWAHASNLLLRFTRTIESEITLQLPTRQAVVDGAL